jgi:hypothetical protein
MSAIAERKQQIARTAMAITQPAGGVLAQLVAEMEPQRHSDWAWSHDEELVLRLSRRFGLSAKCEIGRGARPRLPAHQSGAARPVRDRQRHQPARV